MTQTKWLITFIGIFLFLGFLSGIIEKVYLGSNAGMAVLAPFFEMAAPSSFWEGVGKAFGLLFDIKLYNALWKMFMWDFAMFTGAYAIVRYFLFCISAGMAVTFTLTVMGIIRGGS